jgi:hypothetical protein
MFVEDVVYNIITFREVITIIEKPKRRMTAIPAYHRAVGVKCVVVNMIKKRVTVSGGG